MKLAQSWTLIAGAAAGAVLTLVLSGRDASTRDPAAAAQQGAAVETRALPREPAQQDVAAAPVVPATRDAAESPAASSEPPAPRRFSDADLGTWMEESLDSGYADQAATGLATEQLEQSLGDVTGVRLADLHCGERFCRASLQAEPGAQLDASRLFGLPPFAYASGGFTVVDADGTTRIYYARSGQSLDALRDEATRLPAPVHAEAR